MIDDVGLAQDQFYRAAWIVNGYILGYVVAMPLMGRVADNYGHGRVFAAGAAACSAPAPPWWRCLSDLTMLSIARGVQAVGGGAVVPSRWRSSRRDAPAEPARRRPGRDGGGG